MAKVSELTRKNILTGNESVPAVDSDNTSKKILISDIQKHISDNLGVRTVNFGSSATAFSRSFVADGDIAAKDGVTLHRDGDVIKARKVGDAVVVQESSAIPTRDVNFASLDVDLTAVIWNTTTGTARDDQLKILADGEDLPSGHAYVLGGGSQDQIQDGNAPVVHNFQINGDDELIILGSSKRISRVLSMNFTNTDFVASLNGEGIINTTLSSDMANNSSAFVFIYKYESSSWKIKEAVGLTMYKVKKTLTGNDTGFNIIQPIYNFDKLGDDLYGFASKNYSNFASATYTSNTGLREALHQNIANFYFYFKVVNSKAVYIYTESAFAFSNYPNILITDYNLLPTPAEKFRWENNGYYRQLVQLDNDVNGSRCLDLRALSSLGTFINLEIVRLSVASDNKLTLTFEDFQNKRYFKSYSSGGILGSNTSDRITHANIERTTQGDFLLGRSYNYYYYELKDNQTYIQAVFDTVLNRFRTKPEILADETLQPLRVSSSTSGEKLKRNFAFQASTDEARDFITSTNNVISTGSTYNINTHYKNHLAISSDVKSSGLRFYDAGETSGFLGYNVGTFTLGLGYGTILLAYRKDSKLRVKIKKLLTSNSLTSTGDNRSLIGFAPAAITDGESGQVVFTAQGTILSFFSELLPGHRYYYDKTVKVNNEGKGKLIGLAISPTEIVVQNN